MDLGADQAVRAHRWERRALFWLDHLQALPPFATAAYWHRCFRKAFSALTKLWSFLLLQRKRKHESRGIDIPNDILVKKGQTAYLIAQLYYHYYLRTGEHRHLMEAHNFFDAIRRRKYWQLTGWDRAELERYHMRAAMVALLLGKIQELEKVHPCREIETFLRATSLGQVPFPAPGGTTVDRNVQFCLMINNLAGHVQEMPLVGELSSGCLLVHWKLDALARAENGRPVGRHVTRCTNPSEILAHLAAVSEVCPGLLIVYYCGPIMNGLIFSTNSEKLTWEQLLWIRFGRPTIILVDAIGNSCSDETFSTTLLRIHPLLAMRSPSSDQLAKAWVMGEISLPQMPIAGPIPSAPSQSG